MKSVKEISNEKTLLQEVIHLVKAPIALAFILTPIRFTLELLGIPENFIFLIGLLWLTIGVCVYWGIKYHNHRRFILLFLLSLIVYSSISRLPVALAWWIDTNWQLGTHYGLFFDTFGQVLFNQVIYGSLIQIIPGFIVGSITFSIMRHKMTVRLKNDTIKHG